MIDHYGFQASFAVMAVMALGAWLLVRQASDPPQETEQAQSRRGSSWDLLIDHRMRLLLLVNWLISSCWDVHTFVLPILGHERGLSASVIGSILGAFAIAATVIRLIMPSVAAFLREWAVLAGAMIATALIYAAYPLMQSAWGMAACSILLGFALGSVQPMVMSMLHQITPVHRQGEALGLRLISINVSSILTPLVFGTVGAAIGVASVFWAVGGAVGLGSRAAWHLRRWDAEKLELK